jgi:hypothetical protein
MAELMKKQMGYGLSISLYKDYYSVDLYPPPPHVSSFCKGTLIKNKIKFSS